MRFTVTPGTLAIIAALSLAGCKQEEVKVDDECPKLAAYQAVKDRVIKRLVSPGSAVFPANPDGPLYANAEVIIAKMGDCVFGVSSHVDSQNVAGGLMRTQFSADVKFDRGTGRWSVPKITLVPH